jgi:hypothetical protein
MLYFLNKTLNEESFFNRKMNNLLLERSYYQCHLISHPNSFSCQTRCCKYPWDVNCFGAALFVQYVSRENLIIGWFSNPSPIVTFSWCRASFFISQYWSCHSWPVSMSTISRVMSEKSRPSSISLKIGIVRVFSKK